jgi:hypothetical protein
VYIFFVHLRKKWTASFYIKKIETLY